MNPSQDLHGKVIVITGANSGIGFEAAKQLAQHGANLVLVCRDKRRGETAIEKIKQASQNDNLFLYCADLSVLSEVSHIAKEIRQRFPQIHVLCNNAGSVQREHIITKEGFEWTMVANHLGGFLLTQWLLPNLIAGAKGSEARIVFTSSGAHKQSALDFNDLNLNSNYSVFVAYGRSKLMNLLTAKELQKLYHQEGIVTSSFHPGVVSTGIWKHGGTVVNIISFLLRPFVLSAKKGAETLVWLAASNDTESRNANGRYFYQCRLANTAEFATDNAAKELWQKSMEMVGPFLPTKKV